jgi:RHS repeat-associated protein
MTLPEVLVWDAAAGHAVTARPAISYDYDLLGNRTGETDARGNKTTHVYDVLGRLVKTARPGNVTAKNYYGPAGRLLRTVDGNGHETSYTYYPRGWVKEEIEHRDAGTALTTFYTYDGMGRKLSATDPRGTATETVAWDYTTWYEYDDLGRLVKTILPDKDGTRDDNPCERYAYDPNGNQTDKWDADLRHTQVRYNVRNQPYESVDALGKATRIRYNASGQRLEVEDPLGRIAHYSYNSLGQLAAATDSLGQTTAYTYDKNGNQASVTDARGARTAYAYDSHNRLAETVQPIESGVTRSAWNYYDKAGNLVLTIQAPEGVWQDGATLGTAAAADARIQPTFYTYDALNRLSAVTRWVGGSEETTSYTYDGAGNRATAVDPKGNTTTYSYYWDNLLQGMTVTAGGTTAYSVQYSYDAAGNRTQVSDSNGNVNKYNYGAAGIAYQPDPLNRANAISRSFIDGDGRSPEYRTEYRYTAAGLPTALKYPEATQWLGYSYNENGQPTGVSRGACDAQGNYTAAAWYTQAGGIAYNGDGMPARVALANGVTTTYGYDGAGRLAQLSVAHGGESIFQQTLAYGPAGNITQIADEAGCIWRYEYYLNNELKNMEAPAAYLEAEDTPGDPGFATGDYQSGDGRLDFAAGPEATVSLDYNASSVGLDFGEKIQAIKKIVLAPDPSHTAHRIFAGALDLYLSDNNFSYAKIPRTDWTFAKDDKGAVTITLKEKQAARYLKIHVCFDDWNVLGRPVDKATFLNELGKMVRVYQETGKHREEYAYDHAGNRAGLTVVEAQTRTYAYQYYPHSSRLMCDGKYAYVYDANGNLVEKGSAYAIGNGQVAFTRKSGDGVEYWKYTYDVLNRLIRVEKNEEVAGEYGYDPDGLRVWKRAGGATIHYVFEGAEPIFEKRIAGEQTRIHSYVFALGQHLARVDGAIGDAEAPVYYYHTDHLGSIRAVTDAAGNRVKRADYLAFGGRFQPNGGDLEDWHGFTGKEYDGEAGLYYYGARWYDQETGRFISEDPVGDPNSPNLYAYCANNPVMGTDPTGMYGMWDYIPNGEGYGVEGPQVSSPPPPEGFVVGVTDGPSTIDFSQPSNNPVSLSIDSKFSVDPDYLLTADGTDYISGDPDYLTNLARWTIGLDWWDPSTYFWEYNAKSQQWVYTRWTFCNRAAYTVAYYMGIPVDDFFDLNANGLAKYLANPENGWVEVDPAYAQWLANQGIFVFGVQPARGHGHVVVVIPGDPREITGKDGNIITVPCLMSQGASEQIWMPGSNQGYANNVWPKTYQNTKYYYLPGKFYPILSSDDDLIHLNGAYWMAMKETLITNPPPTPPGFTGTPRPGDVVYAI